MHFFQVLLSLFLCLFVCLSFFAEMHVGHHVGVKVIIGHPSCFGGCCVTRVTVWNSHGHGTPSGTPNFRQRASHKDLQKRIKPNRLGYMKVCSRRLVLEIIFTWARRHRQTPKCAIMIFSVAPGCMSSRTISDDNTCIANSVAVPMYPRLTPADSSRQEMTLPIHSTLEAMSPQRWREFHCFSAPWHIHPWFLNKKDFTRFGLLTEILKLP